jgi:hypothetical protein
LAGGASAYLNVGTSIRVPITISAHVRLTGDGVCAPDFDEELDEIVSDRLMTSNPRGLALSAMKTVVSRIKCPMLISALSAAAAGEAVRGEVDW